jgi:modulator of FtsH protease
VPAYSASRWESFFVADVGAAAALAGLLFVAISINLTRIVEDPNLPGRAGETIVLLLNSLVIGSICLMPGQSHTALGIEVLVVGAIGWAIPVSVQVRNARTPLRPGERRAFRTITTQLAMVPFLVGGVSLIARGGGGLYWVGVGMIATFVAAAAAAWVLMVEILR